MKRRYLFLFFCLICVQFCVLRVEALSIDTIINNNGVMMTTNQYNYINRLFVDGYADIITQDEYNTLLNNNYFNQNIESFTISNSSNQVILKGSIETNAKKLIVNKSCNVNCYVTTTLKWKKTPKIKSYDVIGARFYNTYLISNPITTVLLNNNVVLSPGYDLKNNGFGSSFKLPSNTNNSLTIIQAFEVNKSGELTASYQHARKNSTLEKSKNYTISSSGYGGVFNFAYPSLYDGMQGLTISL